MRTKRSEADTINSAILPLTVESLAVQFQACGLAAGQTVLVHSAMSRLGWIAGGAVAVIQALREVLSPSGTLIMPTHTSDNSEPSYWQNPPVPEFWWPLIREHAPAYDPAVTPTRSMGHIPELFRTLPGVKRSEHPVGSFAAIGPNADFLLHDHRLETAFGEYSPLARLYDLDGYILLLGVDHNNNTSLHLAEERATYPSKRYHQEGCSMQVDGVRQWVQYQTLIYDTDDFQDLGLAYETAHELTLHTVGLAEVRFLRQRPLIDWAVAWMNKYRH